VGALLTLIFGLAIWVVLWAIGTKSFDALMLVLLMLVIAAAARLIGPYLPGNRDR
jgi:hypothetical protein